MDIKVKKRSGKLESFDVEKINKCAYRACLGIGDNNVSASEIILDAQLQLYDKITTKEIDDALILSARAKIEKEPNYSKVAAALAANPASCRSLSESESESSTSSRAPGSSWPRDPRQS